MRKFQMKITTVYSKQGQNTVLINTDMKKSLLLDENGSLIWNLIIELEEEKKVIDELQNRYPMQKGQVKKDVVELLDLLLDFEMLTCVNATK